MTWALPPPYLWTVISRIGHQHCNIDNKKDEPWANLVESVEEVSRAVVHHHPKSGKGGKVRRKKPWCKKEQKKEPQLIVIAHRTNGCDQNLQSVVSIQLQRKSETRFITHLILAGPSHHNVHRKVEPSRILRHLDFAGFKLRRKMIFQRVLIWIQGAPLPESFPPSQTWERRSPHWLRLPRTCSGKTTRDVEMKFNLLRDYLGTFLKWPLDFTVSWLCQ